MAMLLSIAALFVALLALSHKMPRTLRLDKLTIGRGADRVTINPGTVEIERTGTVRGYIGLSVKAGYPVIIGTDERSLFRIDCNETPGVILHDGAASASVLPSGVTIQNEHTKSVLLPGGVMPGLPLSAGNERPATIEEKPTMPREPLKVLAKLRHGEHGLTIHKPADDSAGETPAA